MNEYITISGSGNHVRVTVRKKRRLILRIFAILVLVVLMVLIFSRCNSVDREEIVTGKVKIINVSTIPGHYQSLVVGNSTIQQWIPGTYTTTVEYNSENLGVDGYETYSEFKDKVGQYVHADIIITYYRDGSCSYRAEKLVSTGKAETST